MFDYKEDHYEFLVELENLCESLRTAHIGANADNIIKCNTNIVQHLRKKDEPAF